MMSLKMEWYSIRRYIVLLFVLVSIIVGCKSKNPVDVDSILTEHYYPLKETTPVKDLNRYFDCIDLIPLENDTVCLSGIKKIISTTDKYFALSGGIVYSISKQGDSIAKVGRVGRGPGEYIYLSDFALSPDGQELWCLDVMNKTLIYNNSEGTFRKTINIESITGDCHGIIPISDNEFALYVSNPVNYSDEDADFYCLHYFDSNGKERRVGLKWTDFNVSSSFSKPVSCMNGTCYVLSPESSQPSIVFESGQISKKLYFDFEHLSVPYRFAFNNSENPWECIGDLFDSKYYKLVSSVFISKGDVYFSAFGKDSSLWNFYIPQNHDHGIRWQSMGNYSLPCSAVGYDEGCLLFPFDAYGMTTESDETDPVKRLVIEKFGVPTVPKPCLVKVKMNV